MNNADNQTYGQKQDCDIIEFDIIVCKGNNWLEPPFPLLYGSRNTELSQVRWRSEELEMIDLDWVNADWKNYRRQLETVRMNRDTPIKYVVIPDLEDKRKLNATLNFGWSLIKRGIARICILPIKVNIDLDKLPHWIRPGLPVLTGYKNKYLSDMDLSSFLDYEGSIHTLGGTTTSKILQFAFQHAPKAILGSMDLNSFTHVANYGRSFSKNCITYDHYPGYTRDQSLDLSFKQLSNTLVKIRELSNGKIGDIFEVLINRKATRQLSLEEIF